MDTPELSNNLPSTPISGVSSTLPEGHLLALVKAELAGGAIAPGESGPNIAFWIGWADFWPDQGLDQTYAQGGRLGQAWTAITAASQPPDFWCWGVSSWVAVIDELSEVMALGGLDGGWRGWLKDWRIPGAIGANETLKSWAQSCGVTCSAMRQAVRASAAKMAEAHLTCDALRRADEGALDLDVASRALRFRRHAIAKGLYALRSRISAGSDEDKALQGWAAVVLFGHNPQWPGWNLLPDAWAKGGLSFDAENHRIIGLHP